MSDDCTKRRVAAIAINALKLFITSLIQFFDRLSNTNLTTSEKLRLIFLSALDWGLLAYNLINLHDIISARYALQALGTRGFAPLLRCARHSHASHPLRPHTRAESGRP
jgi:hypothetical protein